VFEVLNESENVLVSELVASLVGDMVELGLVDFGSVGVNVTLPDRVGVFVLVGSNVSVPKDDVNDCDSSSECISEKLFVGPDTVLENDALKVRELEFLVIVL
jgi:hypothetical protein